LSWKKWFKVLQWLWIQDGKQIVFIYLYILINLILLLSMNEGNIKYWFRNFQKIFFIDFLDEFGLFIEEKPICTKKKIPSPAVCRLPFNFPFNSGTSPFGLVDDLVLNRSYWFLDFGNKFRRVAPIRIIGSCFTPTWNNDQF
jgi:hypothetical protein